jgi:riboflavin biosynthesis pyrimidine reductase
MQRLRARADCVLNGSGTVAADQVYWPLSAALVDGRRARGQAEQPLWAVATGSGVVRPDSTMLRKPPPRPIVFAAVSTPADRRDWLGQRADVIVVGEERPDPAAILRTLRRRFACRYVLSEGGPTFTYALLAAGVLDELFLTLAPKVVGGHGKTILDGVQLVRDAWVRLEIVSLYEHADELFLRYRVAQG